MERKMFLELCQQNAMDPRSVFVLFDGAKYYPIEYRLCFDENGKTIHRAVLLDCNLNSVTNCPLDEVKEYESN